MTRLVTSAVALAILVLAQLSYAEDEPAAAGKAQSEIEGYLRLAAAATARGNIEVAETFYQHLLSVDAPEATKRPALVRMADFYQDRHDLAKAIAVLEQIHETAPDDPGASALLLRLGRLYREAGSYKLALARFYSVLNSALKINEPTLKEYRDLTLQAQMEIAETYFVRADYAQANKFYNLLGKLELAREDKATAAFRSAYCSYLLDDKPGAEKAAKGFLKDYSETKYAPECHYLLARTLKALNRPEEATEEVLALLRTEKKLAETNEANWAYWQQKAGNQLANEFYLQGDLARAVVIYQALARLNNSPDWLWPVVYQMGLCFERMRLPERAKEAYAFVVNESKKPSEGQEGQTALEEIVKMAGWRNEQLTWQGTTESSLQALIGNPLAPEEFKTTSLP